MEILLAQHVMDDDGGSLALTLFVLAAMSVFWVALGYVCWIFWKAKKRDDAESGGEDAWRNARSS